jgi:hypothetical protein
MQYLISEANWKVVTHSCTWMSNVGIQFFVTMHSDIGIGWIFVEFKYNQIQATIIVAIQGA